MTTTSSKSSPAKGKAKRYPKSRSRYRKNNSGIIIVAGGLVGLLILVFILVNNNSRGGTGPIEGVQSFTNLDRSHTSEPVNYAQNPPVGGPHDSVWQNCGVYTSPIEDEHAVHSLEHGVVWITYQPDLPVDELEQLQALTRQSGFRLLSPYPDLPSPIVASAWGYQLKLNRADDPRLAEFIQAYEQNPRGPEPGAPCTGGTGQPS